MTLLHKMTLCDWIYNCWIIWPALLLYELLLAIVFGNFGTRETGKCFSHQFIFFPKSFWMNPITRNRNVIHQIGYFYAPVIPLYPYGNIPLTQLCWPLRLKKFHGSRETRPKVQFSASAGTPPPSWIKAQMQLLSGGRWVDQTHHKVVKDRNPIHCIHVSLVPGHEFPINCRSQHGWKKSFCFQAGLEPGTLCFSIMVLDHPNIKQQQKTLEWKISKWENIFLKGRDGKGYA